MEDKYSEELNEKEVAGVKAEKDKYLKKVDTATKSKEKSEEAILKDLYAKCVEKVKSRQQKMRDANAAKKKIDMLHTDKESSLRDINKLYKETTMLKGLCATLEKQNEELQQACTSIMTKHEKERKEINEGMQGEIKKIQEDMEGELRRKSVLSQENEAIDEKIKELKDMLTRSSDTLEKSFGKSELDIAKLEEQLKDKIETETTKIVVSQALSKDFQNDEKDKVKRENEALSKSVLERAKVLEDYQKQFEEYKTKITKTNTELNAYKTDLEEV